MKLISTLISFFTALALCLAAPWASAADLNGFDVSDALIPVSEIFHGGPPRDGIPAIDRPRFITIQHAENLLPDDRVLGLARNGIAKAYPIAIMNWHEIVNDHYGEQAVVVSYCPLCGSGVAFAAQAGAQKHTFGVSGLLYNSDVLLYDRETESLWSQIMARAVSGPRKNTPLTVLALDHTSWADWRARHPDTLVLARDTGHRRDYDRDPYQGYADSERIFFPVSHSDRRYHPKERVIGVTIEGRYKAYPFVELAKQGGDVRDRFGAVALRIVYDTQHQRATVYNEQDEVIPAITAFWFAWTAFHPDSEVYRAP